MTRQGRSPLSSQRHSARLDQTLFSANKACPVSLEIESRPRCSPRLLLTSRRDRAGCVVAAPGRRGACRGVPRCETTPPPGRAGPLPGRSPRRHRPPSRTPAGRLRRPLRRGDRLQACGDLGSPEHRVGDAEGGEMSRIVAGLRQSIERPDHVGVRRRRAALTHQQRSAAASKRFRARPTSPSSAARSAPSTEPPHQDRVRANVVVERFGEPERPGVRRGHRGRPGMPRRRILATTSARPAANALSAASISR